MRTAIHGSVYLCTAQSVLPCIARTDLERVNLLLSRPQTRATRKGQRWLAPAGAWFLIGRQRGKMKRNWFLFPLILLCASPLSFGQLWSGIIAPPRAVDWSHAGVVGGIPSGSWTQCGSTIAAGTSASAINSAINACSANHYVQLGAGTFNLTTGLVLKSHVALRGMGADQTFLIFTGANGCGGEGASVCMVSGDVNYWGKPSNLANWTAGYAPGTTSITLSSKTNLAVGTPVTLDQADDTSDNGDIFVCYTPKGVCSTNGDNGGFLRANRSQEQVVTVTSISGSGPYTVGISPGIYMPNWSSSKSPQAWWPTSPIVSAGVENLSIDSSHASNESVGIFNCSGCWVSGIRSIDPARSHVMAWQSPHTTVQNSYFYRTANQSSSSYGLEFNNSSDSVAQNNIFQQLSAPYVNNGSCSGCVMSYNFDVNNLYNSGGGVYNYQQQSWYPHTAGDDHILAEGNQGAGMYSDNFHGTHQFQTLFRNAYNGRQPNNGNTTTGGLGALLINAYSRFYNVVGNVLGTSSFGRYRSDMGGGSGSAIVAVGIGDGVPNDPDTGRTLMMWGNYDTVTGAVRWCGNSSSPGWSSTCANTSEVPSGIANYANPVPASTSLPASFYLNGKPAWWPSSKPWPAIGPDVTGGNLSAYAGHAYSIPAADCYSNVMRGAADGTGSVLSFSAAACYGTSGGTGGTPPGGDATLDPPTGLTAVVD
jgi:hypothetical protein